jgi:hypothetical protein
MQTFRELAPSAIIGYIRIYIRAHLDLCVMDFIFQSKHLTRMSYDIRKIFSKHLFFYVEFPDEDSSAIEALSVLAPPCCHVYRRHLFITLSRARPEQLEMPIVSPCHVLLGSTLVRLSDPLIDHLRRLPESTQEHI